MSFSIFMRDTSIYVNDDQHRDPQLAMVQKIIDWRVVSPKWKYICAPSSKGPETTEEEGAEGV